MGLDVMDFHDFSLLSLDFDLEQLHQTRHYQTNP